MSSAGASGSGGSGGGGGGGGGGGPCGACKFLRRKCVSECVFAPYFDAEQGAAHFAAVHKVFGASNVSKLLLQIPPHKRLDAVVTICYEAQARLRDPVYGCVSHVFSLQQQVVNLQSELSYLQSHLATLEMPQPPPPLPAAAHVPMPGSFSMSDLPPSSNIDLSSIFDPATQAQWMHHHGHQHPPLRQQLYSHTGEGSGEGGGDLQALARELLGRHGRSGDRSPPHSH